MFFVTLCFAVFALVIISSRDEDTGLVNPVELNVKMMCVVPVLVFLGSLILIFQPR